MKKLALKVLGIMSICLMGILTSQAQIIVKVRPGIPVAHVRPVSPGRGYIWVDGEYVHRGGQYVYTDGYWTVPPARYRSWKPGHWRQKRGGWVWIPGHWK